MASSPKDRLAEVKSFISAIISPLGMVAGGGAILLIYSRLTKIEGYILALAIGLLYLVMTYFQNRAYVSSLKSRITYDFSGRYNTKLEFSEYEEFFSDKNHDDNSIEIMEDIFNENPSIEAVEVLHRYYGKLSPITKENILKLLNTGTYEDSTDIIIRSLEDVDPYIRAIALINIKTLNINEGGLR